jgi:putative transposase
MSIAINSIIKYVLNTENEVLEIVLWICRERNEVVTYDLNTKALPTFKTLSDIEELIELREAVIVSLITNPMIRDDELNKNSKLIRQNRWDILKEIVNLEPDIYIESKRGKLINKVVIEKKITKKLIYKLLRLYWGNGKTISSLIPHYYNCGGKGKDKASGDRKRGVNNSVGINVTDEIKEYIRKGYKKFHLDKGLPIPQAYQRTLETYFSEGYFTNEQGNLVPIIKDKCISLHQFRYWGNRLFSTKEQLIGLFGLRKFELNHRAVLGETTTESYAPGRRFQVDATIADIYLVSRLNSNWIIGRPVVYIIIDTFSRRIVGFYVGLEGPSWLGAMMALYNTTRNKVSLCNEYGISISEDDWDCCYLPDSLIVDRGEFESTKPLNLIQNLGVDVKILPPYRADWKGIIEQTFRRFNNKTLHWLDGTIKKEFRVRGDQDYRLGALLSLYEFTQIIIHSILYFNNSHMEYYDRDDQLIRDNVPSIPNELWKWGIKNRSGSLKTFHEDIIKLNLMPHEECTLTYRGLLFQKRRYSCAEFVDSGIYEQIRKYGSVKKTISYDPRDENFVYINHGDKFIKLNLLNETKRNLYYEEIECLNEFEKRDKDFNLKTNIQKTANLNANIDEIIKNANGKYKESLESNKKRIINIANNRKAEKELNRIAEAWELDENSNLSKDSKLIQSNKDYDEDEYVPRPTYTDLVIKKLNLGGQDD